MGLFTKPIKTLEDLLVHLLQDIYYAENQITKALPTMIGRTTNPHLRAAFESHLHETEGQIGRLEQVFRMLDVEVKGVTCEAIDGILTEAKHVMSDIADSDVLQAAMLASAQAVEHYEIARYGTMIALLRQLGRADCGSVLEQTLAEEKATDEKLSKLATAEVNREAA